MNLNFYKGTYAASEIYDREPMKSIQNHVYNLKNVLTSAWIEGFNHNWPEIQWLATGNDFVPLKLDVTRQKLHISYIQPLKGFCELNSYTKSCTNIFFSSI